MNLKFGLVFLTLFQIKTCTSSAFIPKVQYLEVGNVKECIPQRHGIGFYETEMKIYCYRGSPKSIWKYFQTVYLQLDIETDDYTQYDGSTPEIVEAHHDEHKSIFSFNFLSYKNTRTKLTPFNQTCIGIETTQPYKIQLISIRADIWKISYFIIGVLAFFFAANLSKNSLFYYTSGISLGICASFIIVVFLAGKLFPRRPMMYGVLIGGWTIVYYIVRLLWENIQLILISYYSYVLWYVLITGFISFVICYRLGPPKNQRSKNLIKWTLQLTALIFIYFSTEFEEASISVIVLSMFFHYVPRKWFGTFYRIYLKWFPPKRRLLTIEEFDKQGARETKKALEELRKYCNSPECKQWKTMVSLKNPKRFASFVEGEEHLMDEEIFDHEEKIDNTDSEISDDDDEEIDEEQEISEDEEINFRNSSSTTHHNASYPYRHKQEATNSRYSINNRKMLYKSYD